jgi:hypothetical protein
MLGGLWTTYLADQPLDFFRQREREIRSNKEQAIFYVLLLV